MATFNIGTSGVTPRPVKTVSGDNYLALSEMVFTQQYLPEVYEKEVERFGKRTVGGFPTYGWC